MTLVSAIPVNSDLAATNAVLPAGTVISTVGTVEPTGWLFCDGRAVSRSTYATLFTALGGGSSPYGTGDGSTTFNLPDLRGRIPVGADSYGAGAAGRLPNSNRARGQTGGEERHTLTAGESGMPTHGHGINDPGHTHLGSNNLGLLFGSGVPAGSGIGAPDGAHPNQVTSGATNTGTTGVTVASASGASASAAHNVLQPYQCFLWLVKT